MEAPDLGCPPPHVGVQASFEPSVGDAKVDLAKTIRQNLHLLKSPGKKQLVVIDPLSNQQGKIKHILNQMEGSAKRTWTYKCPHVLQELAPFACAFGLQHLGHAQYHPCGSMYCLVTPAPFSPEIYWPQGPGFWAMSQKTRNPFWTAFKNSQEETNHCVVPHFEITPGLAQPNSHPQSGQEKAAPASCVQPTPLCK